MKKNNWIIYAVVMVLCGACVCFAGNSYISNMANAEAERIKALIGDAEILEGTGSAQGFAGEVTAQVKYANGIIVGLNLKGDEETPNIGGAAMTELKDKILAAGTLEGIDAVSGATYTSNAVFDAVRSAMGIEVVKKTDAEIFDEIAAVMLPGNTKLETELVENVLEVREAGGKKLMLVQGVGHYADNPFKVAVLLDENAAVEDIAVVYSHETDGFGSEVLIPSYWEQYFGATQITRKSNGEGTKIDVVSGATETSVGLYNCVKAAFEQF